MALLVGWNLKSRFLHEKEVGKMLLVLYAFISVILAAIFALVTAAAVVLLAFTIYALGGRSVAERFFPEFS